MSETKRLIIHNYAAPAILNVAGLAILPSKSDTKRESARVVRRNGLCVTGDTRLADHSPALSDTPILATPNDYCSSSSFSNLFSHSRSQIPTPLHLRTILK